MSTLPPPPPSATRPLPADLADAPDELLDALAAVWAALDTIARATDAGIARRLGSYTDDALVTLLVACERLATAAKIAKKYGEDETRAKHPDAGWALAQPGVGRVSMTKGSLVKTHDVAHFLTTIACAAYPKLDGSPCDATELPIQPRTIVERAARVLSSASLGIEALRAEGLNPDDFIRVVGRKDPTINIKEA